MKYLQYIGISIGVVLVLLIAVGFISRRGILPGSTDLQQEIPANNTFEPQTNSGGSVNVTVLPKNLSDAGTWDFDVTFSTHSVELSEDVTQISALVGDDGREYAPISWDGDPPGGHHREGILKFEPIVPTPRSITLKIRKIDGVDERSFRWQMP